LNRTMNETQVRNVDGGPYKIEPTYFKNFTWMRNYSLRWELTRSLSFDYSATNQSRIDEPYGRIDTREKKDTLWQRIMRFGRNTHYTQNFGASYNVPLQKIPATDWTSLRLTYGSSYTWTAASQLARSLGNTISNTQTKQVNGELDFKRLYQKNKWLKAASMPKPKKPKTESSRKKPGKDNAKGQDSLDEKENMNSRGDKGEQKEEDKNNPNLQEQTRAKKKQNPEDTTVLATGSC
jgi:cell surface protein SprA